MNETSKGIIDVVGGRETFKIEHIVSIPLKQILASLIAILGAGILYQIIKKGL